MCAPPLPTPGMQRQHLLVYLAALDEPLATGLDSQINFQPYPGSDMAEYAVWGTTGVSTGQRTGRFTRSPSFLYCAAFSKKQKKNTDCALHLTQRLLSRFQIGPLAGWANYFLETGEVEAVGGKIRQYIRPFARRASHECSCSFFVFRFLPQRVACLRVSWR